MFEIFLLVVVFGAIVQFAEKRGGDPLTFIVAAFGGYYAIAYMVKRAFGPGPDQIAGGLWVALVFGSIFFLAGGGRRAQDTWQCPDCQLFNDPLTLVCGCGQKYSTG